jgi:DNA-binding transcriptional ArsR family regulator
VSTTVVAPRWAHELPTNVDVRRQVGLGLQTYFEHALSQHWTRMLAHLHGQAAAPIVLAVPALRSIADAQGIWAATRSTTPRPLAALLGETRSAALDVISDGCTTSQLARRLRISAATASHHATVLRSAGLVLTQRAGSAVLHTLTPLGSRLLESPRDRG